MPLKLLISLCLFIVQNTLAQDAISKTISKYNSGSIPYITVNELKTEIENNPENLIILDARAFKEYQISALKNAIWVGYKNFNANKLSHVSKSKKIVVYCSIGVRSEKIGEKLQTLGFTNVKNLYGGIFKWVNMGNEVYKNNKPTPNVHAYSKRWRSYLTNGNAVLN